MITISNPKRIKNDFSKRIFLTSFKTTILLLYNMKRNCVPMCFFFGFSDIKKIGAPPLLQMKKISQTLLYNYYCKIIKNRHHLLHE